MTGEHDGLAAGAGGIQGNEFLEAVIAVCVLAAGADDEVQLCERETIGSAILTDPALHGLSIDMAQELLEHYAARLESGAPRARADLSEKVLRMEGDPKRARTLMRVAYRIMSADHTIQDKEKAEFTRLCRLLDLDPESVWRDSMAAINQAQDLGIL
jgi:tellurite resistance protein TerB